MTKKTMIIRNKIIQTPEFIPSLTTIKNFANYDIALNFLYSQEINHMMVSAYDLFYLQSKPSFLGNNKEKEGLIFFDSGAFEIYNSHNPNKWSLTQLIDIVNKFNPDIVVSLDNIDFNEKSSDLEQYNYDKLRETFKRNTIFYEFVLQGRNLKEINNQLNKIDIDKNLLAICIPERNLGNEFKKRRENLEIILKLIRKEYGFDEVFFHLMGCSYPKFLSIYSKMGVDLFDGVHWNDSLFDNKRKCLRDFSELLLINCDCFYCNKYKDIVKNNRKKSEYYYNHFVYGHNLIQYKEYMKNIRMEEK